MSFVGTKQAADNLREYENLEMFGTQLVNQTTQWMARATALHGATADATEKSEVLALRAALIANLKTALGI